MQAISQRAAAAALTIFLSGFTAGHATDADAVSGATGTHHEGLAGIAGQPGMMAMPMDSKWADELGLTLEQRDRLKLIAYEMEPRLRALRDQGKALGEALKAMSPDDPNFATLTASASQQAAALAAESVNVMAELRQRTHGLLTDEQKAQLKAKIEARKQAHEESGHAHGNWREYWQRKHGASPDADPTP